MFTQNNQPTQHMNKNKKTSVFKNVRAIAMAAALSVPLSAEAAELFSVDFGGQAGAATGPAILSGDNNFWNTIGTGPATLYNATSGGGAYNTSGATLATTGWSGTYGGASYGVSGYVPLTGDFAYNTTGTASITVADLAANDSYTWVFYLNQGGGSRQLSITVDGTTLSTTGAVDKSALVSGVNYLTFQGVIGLSGSLVANFAFASGNAGEMDVNGFQLQTDTIPEPSTYALVLGGIATLLLIRRRVQA
jgi:hypothetical protein